MSGRYSRMIAITIDRLGIGCLGPYGATWNETPGWNAWSALSLTCEKAFSDGHDLSRVFRSYWTGSHAVRPSVSWETSLPRQLSARDWASRLFTDDQSIAELGETAGFADVALFQDEVQTTASDLPNDVDLEKLLDKTSLGRAFATAWENLSALPERSLGWFHFRGVGAAWDAPYAWRAAYCDDGDPLPPRNIDPVSQVNLAPVDPDERWGIVRSYAAQVKLVDLLLERTAELIESLWGMDSCLVVVTSPRGFALGDHASIGVAGDALTSEVLRVPLFVTDFGQRFALARSQAIVQPTDLWATFLDGACIDKDRADKACPTESHSLLSLVAGDSAWPRDRGFAVSADEQAVVTHAWFFRQSKTGESAGELYVQPDDGCDANAIGSRRPDVVEMLSRQLDEFAQKGESGSFEQLPPLPTEATSIWR